MSLACAKSAFWKILDVDQNAWFLDELNQTCLVDFEVSTATSFFFISTEFPAARRVTENNLKLKTKMSHVHNSVFI